MNAAGPYYRLQDIMTAFRAVLADDLSPEERQKQAYRFQYALRHGEGADEPKPQTLHEALEARLRAGEEPGRTIPWIPFCDAVRKDLGVKACHRGYSDKSIYREVRAIQGSLSDLSEKRMV